VAAAPASRSSCKCCRRFCWGCCWPLWGPFFSTAVADGSFFSTADPTPRRWTEAEESCSIGGASIRPDLDWRKKMDICNFIRFINYSCKIFGVEAKIVTKTD
jgi:hypothetical protein